MQFIGAEILLIALGWLCREKKFILIMLLTIIPRVCIDLKVNAELQKT